MSTGDAIELGAGAATGVLGLGALVWDLLGPTYSFSSSAGGVDEAGTRSLLEVGLSAEAGVFLAVVGLLCVGVAAGAVLHVRRRPRGVTAGLWAAALLLGLAAVVSGFSVGPTLLPASLAALLAALAASLNGQ